MIRQSPEFIHQPDGRKCTSFLMRQEVTVSCRVGHVEYVISVSSSTSVAELLERINTNLHRRDLRWVYRGSQRLANDALVWDNNGEGHVLDIFAGLPRRRSITACPAMANLPALRPLAARRRGSFALP
jgi:hypothetical protein